MKDELQKILENAGLKESFHSAHDCYEDVTSILIDMGNAVDACIMNLPDVPDEEYNDIMEMVYNFSDTLSDKLAKYVTPIVNEPDHRSDHVVGYLD